MNDRVLCVLNDICQEITPGKKVVQKLFYLVQRKGVDLGLDYKIHFYGPYSSDLNSLLHSYEADSLLEIDTSGMTHKIKTLCKETTSCLKTDEEKTVCEIIKSYANKSPTELELLTTTDFVAFELSKYEIPNPDDIISSVKRIKGGKFSVSQIRDSIIELKDAKLIAS